MRADTLTYRSLENNDVFQLIDATRKGLDHKTFDKGAEVFGNTSNFLGWINSRNIPLGGVKPIDLLDNAFGINMVKDELIKIEHGVLA